MSTQNKPRGHNRSAKGGIPQRNPFIEMLQNTTIGDIVPNRKVLVLQNTNSVNEALQCLGKYKILSAPVLDSQTNSFLGFVDVLDIVSLVVNIYYGGDRNNNSFVGQNFALKNAQFLLRPVQDVLDLSTKSPASYVLLSTSLFQCIGLFQKGVHRVAVMNAEGITENILTQTDVVRFLISKIPDYPAVFDKTIAELNLGTEKKIYSIPKNEKAIHALKMMNDKKVSAIAVVDEIGRIVGNISASDLKGRGTTDYGDGADPFGTLQLPVLTFLKYGGMSIFPVGTCTKSMSFHFLLLKLMALRVHRLWVVNDEDKPTSLITLTDIMQALVAQKQPDRKD